MGVLVLGSPLETYYRGRGRRGRGLNVGREGEHYIALKMHSVGSGRGGGSYRWGRKGALREKQVQT